jgi:hypothetical protein
MTHDGVDEFCLGPDGLMAGSLRLEITKHKYTISLQQY